MSSTTNPVAQRVLFFEKNRRDGVERLRFLPFYLVTSSGGHGKLFEPVDALKRGTTPISNTYVYKEIHKIVEFDGNAKMLNSEKNPDGKECMLHSFQSWEWPIA